MKKEGSDLPSSHKEGGMKEKIDERRKGKRN
jgi:hypothetical protein